MSIHTVAAAAGVSIATVSRVMNTPELVSSETATRVQKVIRELGYVPNPFAHGLSKRQSRVIGIALPDIFGEFYSELLRGANAEAHRLGYHLLISSEIVGLEPQDADSGTDRRPRQLSSGLIDGMAVMLTEPNESTVARLETASIPVVVVDLDLRERGFDSVIVDNAPGTAEAVRHLLTGVSPARCHFVGGPRENFDTRERALAFAATLAEAGHPPQPSQIVFGSYSVEWGAAWARQAAERGDLRGAGVLAGNDEIAVGIMQAAEDAGLSIPGDVRLVGFDDTRLAALVRPRLSTVRVPMADVGAAAVRALVRRLEDRDSDVEAVHLQTHLVVRESSSPGAV